MPDSAYAAAMGAADTMLCDYLRENDAEELLSLEPDVTYACLAILGMPQAAAPLGRLRGGVASRHPVAGSGLRSAVERVANYRRAQQQRVVLEHHRDVAVFGRHLGEVTVADPDRAAGHRVEAGQHSQ